MLKVVPSALVPLGSKARTAKMRACGAVPMSLPWAAIRPAMAVP